MEGVLRSQRLLGLVLLVLLSFTFMPAVPTPAQTNNRLPVFRLTKLSVSDTTTQQLGGVLEGIGRGAPTGQDEFRGRNRFFRLNEQNRTVLTQYAASGGFFAYDIDGLGRETPAGSVNVETAKRLACLFLTNNNFVGRDGVLAGNSQSNYPVRLAALPGNCNSTKDFGRTTLIRAAQAPVGGAGLGQVSESIVGVVVEVPFGFVNGQDFINIGGAGGHLSLLFTHTDTVISQQGGSDSLDNAVPGLAAVAMPFFGRSLDYLGEVPVRDLNTVRNEVQQMVERSYPDATVDVPAPRLSYVVDDAAVEQTVLEPEAVFEDITVTLPNGDVIVLRSFSLPLAESGSGGFGPTVAITTPANGSLFNTGQPLNLTGNISDGTAPYTYQWLLDDETPLSNVATLNAAGSVNLSAALPASVRETSPTVVTVILRVTDNNGIQRDATISLIPDFRFLYIPVVTRSGTSTSALPTIDLTQTSYTFGVEGNWDYPPAGPGGSDLPGVIPDVNGFSIGMIGYGYTSRFFWSNANAWEKDWRDCSLGGVDCSDGVDRAAFVYYAGHGGPGGIAMASNKDSTWFDGRNARYQNLRWVGFASCQTLRVQGYTAGNEPIRRWFNAFQGAHMLLGFNSNMADIAFGGQLVANMRMPSFPIIGDLPWAQLTIAQAWVKTAFDMNAGKPAYIYARSATVNPINDKLPKPGSAFPSRPTPVTSYHWVWWEF
ncbi:DUF6345 domain-containing protein [Chloroflexus sp. MS-G]|uniref:DUF6345 domain-containing protein n=1 Tax=Chloroflexus sp. MS-G TaxID=1521187 RepID=UPI0004DF7345|nr:DUF6345 domain-containing protein [Chloroflexus sp. MS-G]